MRFAPTFAEHITRYAFAMHHVYKRSVLDAGSKDGFGSQVLSWVAKDITLADISELWLGAAGKKTYECPVSFVVSDFEVSFPEGEWDTVVAFEVIEHLANPEFFIENVAKHLKVGGKLVFSVPHLVANKEHKTLFDEEKIRGLISRFLRLDEFYVQDKEALSGKPLYMGLKCYVGVAAKNSDDNA